MFSSDGEEAQDNGHVAQGVTVVICLEGEM